jgi:hypothetical protein
MKGKRACERILSIQISFFKKRTRKAEITRFQWRNISGRLQYALVTANLINEFHGAEFFFEKPLVAQLLKILPIFYGTRRFITVFRAALHYSLS